MLALLELDLTTFNKISLPTLQLWHLLITFGPKDFIIPLLAYNKFFLQS